MIITLSGVTGVGKSFYKKLIVSELGFENMVISTTRNLRSGEANGVDKYYISNEECIELEKNGKVKSFEFLGNKYAYDIEKLQSSQNQVTELHYAWIDEYRKNAKDLFAIYILPNNLERAKEELKKRRLPVQTEKERLDEIDEHIKNFLNNDKLQSQFDYIFTNNYDKESQTKLLQVIKSKIEGR